MIPCFGKVTKQSPYRVFECSTHCQWGESDCGISEEISVHSDSVNFLVCGQASEYYY